MHRGLGLQPDQLAVAARHRLPGGAGHQTGQHADTGTDLHRSPASASSSPISGGVIAAAQRIVVGKPAVRVGKHRPGLREPAGQGLPEHRAQPARGQHRDVPARPDGRGQGDHDSAGIVHLLQQVMAQHQIGGARRDHRASDSASAWMPVTRSATPASWARRCRIARASAEESTTVTRQPATASGTARVPLPPPTSTTRCGEWRSHADQCGQRQVHRIDDRAGAAVRSSDSSLISGLAQLVRPSHSGVFPAGQPAGHRALAAGSQPFAAYRRAPTIPGLTAPGLYGWPVSLPVC